MRLSEKNAYGRPRSSVSRRALTWLSLVLEWEEREGWVGCAGRVVFLGGMNYPASLRLEVSLFHKVALRAERGTL